MLGTCILVAAWYSHCNSHPHELFKLGLGMHFTGRTSNVDTIAIMLVGRKIYRVTRIDTLMDRPGEVRTQRPKIA